MAQETNYVTNGKLNAIVFEIKNDIRDINEHHNKQYTELRHSNETLNSTLVILSDNIKENSVIMKEISQDLRETKDDIGQIKTENITRDYKIEDLEEFKEEASGKLSGRFKETLAFFGIIVTVFGGIVGTIISVAPALFGG